MHCAALSITKTVKTDAGELAYSDLVLALGTDAVRFPILGEGAQDVLSVNDLADYRCFRAALNGARRVLIMGAGLIGCEFANDLLHGGITPIVVDPNLYPLASLAPLPVGEALMKQLEAAGTQWHMGNRVERIERSTAGYRATLLDGTLLEVDVVLSAVGLKPRIALAQAAAIVTRKGILVDGHGQTTAPNVNALGDCAEYARGTLMPFVRPTLIAARSIAATLAGSKTPIDFPVMPIMVKTPAHPVVVQAPHAGAQGNWSAQAQTEGQQWLFKDSDEVLRGYVVTGAAAKGHMKLAKLLGSRWPD
ncbi:MAG: FAD-dependent oxidoreductase [Pseudomonas sp.]